MAGPVHKVTPCVKNSVADLTELRNEFTHFKPGGWSLTGDFLNTEARRITLDVIGLIEDIANDGYSLRHLEQDEQTELKETIAKIRNCLSNG